MSTPCIAQASIVNGHTINSRSAGVPEAGGEESSFSDFRSIVTARLDIIVSFPTVSDRILSLTRVDHFQQYISGNCCKGHIIDVAIEKINAAPCQREASHLPSVVNDS